MDPNPQDAKQLNVGDTVAVFIGSFDPPTMDHYRAIETLLKQPEIKDIWICPLSGDNDSHVRNMASALCFDFQSSSRQVSFCSIALDKTMKTAGDAMNWVRIKFPYLKFKAASVAPEVIADSDTAYYVKLGVLGDTAPAGSKLIAVDSFAAVVPDLKARIKSGLDETRSFILPIWNYIQKNKLYRK